MGSLESRLFCRLDGLSAAAREQQRLLSVADLGLLEADSVPVFEEAAQTASRFLAAPVSWLGIMDRDNLWLRAAVGLSKLGLMNRLAKTRRLSREESFCTHVVDSQQVFVVQDTLHHPALSPTPLAQQYGIRAYMAAPLLVSSGHCLGTLAVLDLEPREFSDRDVQTLELIARWCVSEFERDAALKYSAPGIEPKGLGGFGLSTYPSGASDSSSLGSSPTFTRALTAQAYDSGLAESSVSSTTVSSNGVGHRLGTGGPNSTPGATSSFQGQTAGSLDLPHNPLRLQLVGQLTQQLRAPLTAVLGMAGMLSREIYGPLTEKQREYLDVIHRSGQTLLSLIQEIMDLAALEEDQTGLNLTPVDVELLSQQIIHNLSSTAKQRNLDLRFSVEPGQRTWHLDKDKVRQMLYHLLFSIIQSANTDSVLRLHVSRKVMHLQFSLWISHPWLGDGLAPAEIQGADLLAVAEDMGGAIALEEEGGVGLLSRRKLSSEESLDLGLANPMNTKSLSELLESASVERPENLRLLLSRHLAELQGGQLFVQSSLEAGYRYIALLPINEAAD